MAALLRILCVSCLLLIPAAAPGDGVSFFEDFNDGNAQGFAILEGSWNVVGGAFHSHTEGFEDMSCAAFGKDKWADYRIACDVRSDGGFNHILLVRAADPWLCYEINVRTGGFQDVFVLKRTGFGHHAIKAYAPLPCPVADTFHIEVTVAGAIVIVAINGFSAIVWKDYDEPYRQGYAALCGFSGGTIQTQDIYFDNVMAEDLVVPSEPETWGRIKSIFR